MATTGHTNNYTIGKGEIYFDRFDTDGVTRLGERYLGNTPGFTMTVASEKLDHFSSDQGIRVRDASVVLETTTTGTLTVDDLSMDNLALFFFGAKSTVTQAQITSTTETLVVMPGFHYPIGITDARPTGVRKITVTGISAATPTETAVLGTDYLVDSDNGRIEILAGGIFAAGAARTITVTYTAVATTFAQMASGATAIRGAMWLKPFNPVGAQYNWYLPKVELTPNGEFQVKGEEWGSMEFQVEALVDGSKSALYIGGQPT